MVSGPQFNHWKAGKGEMGTQVTQHELEPLGNYQELPVDWDQGDRKTKEEAIRIAVIKELD